MAKRESYLNSSVRIDNQHTTQKILRLVRDASRHFEFTSLDLLQQLAHILVIEWKPPGQQREQHYSTRPDIRRATVVPLPRDDLGASVMRTTTTGFEELVPIRLVGSHSEVGDLDLLFFAEEKVFRFEVAMTDVELVAVVDAADDLSEVGEGFGEVETALGDEVVEELSTLDVLE